MSAIPPPILALGPDWQALYAAAGTRDQRALVEAIAARALAAAGPAASVDAVPELASDDEVAPLADFLESLARRQRPADDPYERHKTRTAQRQRDKSEAGREIGPLPPVQDPERRAACARNLSLFLPTYFPNAFKRPSGPIQLTMMKRIQVACLLGALFAVAVPRGSGKTAICIRALLWSQLYRHHLYAMILGATDGAGLRAIVAIKRELRFNPQLAADFPEVCYPIFRLGGINQRASGQLLDGQSTLIEWTDTRIILPTIAGVPGAIVEAGSLLAAVRGAQYTTAAGEIWRPSFVLVDDFQTRESARSLEQVQTRLETINGDVLGLAGPGEPLACVIPCTIIVAGDGADQLTDRERSPVWRGQRSGIFETPVPPIGDDWLNYFEILDEIKFVEDDDEEALQRVREKANAYYAQRREAMDAGFRPTWPERRESWELSAVQNAMNLLHRMGEAAWQAECMNAPLDPFAVEDDFLTADAISKLFSGYSRGIVPVDAQFITCGIDVQHRCLYWLVAAWETNFTGAVVDYGCYPEQKRQTWTARKAEHTLAQLYPKRSTEAAIYAGLRDLHNDLLTRAWKRVDGQELHVNLALTDAGEKTTTVKKAIRESDHVARLLPSFGQRIGPERRAISTYEPKAGERIGEEWIIRPGRGKSGRHVRMDIGYWKSFLQSRLSTPNGSRGSLTLYGRQNSRPHSFLARHLTSETRKRVVGVRPVDLWDLRPGESENHWLDCAVMAAVAASICGAQITGPTLTKSKRGGRKRTAQYFNL